MANFKTHVQFATIGCALASSALLSTQTLNVKEAVLCWIAGSIGGILPDIDSDNSHSLTILFGIFTLIVCAATVAMSVHMLPILWVWGLCLAVYLVMQLCVRKIFESFTIHRGICHSLLAGAAAGLGLVFGSYQLGLSAATSWFLGAFLSFGFLLHLLLDEIYSVDFMNVSVKRSFGTAIKLFDYGNMRTSLALSVLTIFLAVNAPPYTGFIDKLVSANIVATLTNGINLSPGNG